MGKYHPIILNGAPMPGRAMPALSRLVGAEPPSLKHLRADGGKHSGSCPRAHGIT